MGNLSGKVEGERMRVGESKGGEDRGYPGVREIIGSRQ